MIRNSIRHFSLEGAEITTTNYSTVTEKHYSFIALISNDLLIWIIKLLSIQCFTQTIDLFFFFLSSRFSCYLIIILSNQSLIELLEITLWMLFFLVKRTSLDLWMRSDLKYFFLWDRLFKISFRNFIFFLSNPATLLQAVIIFFVNILMKTNHPQDFRITIIYFQTYIVD